MLSKFWQYTDKSDPTIPSKNIEWKLSIPFILKINSSIGWANSGTFSIRFLLFGVHYARHLFTGNRLNIQVWPWTIELSVGRGYNKSHLITLWMGVPENAYLDWQIKRSINRMTPEQKLKLKQTFNGILK